MKQKEIGKGLGYSSSTSHGFGDDIKMQSPYKKNNTKRSPKTSKDLKRPQMTSNVEKNEPVVKKSNQKTI